MQSFETLLVLGVFILYIYDSLMLLSINELLITRSRNNWSYKLPFLEYQLLRKYPLLPNLLMPGIAIFRTYWPGPSTKSSNINEVNDFIKKLLPIQLIIYVLLVLQLIILPMIVYYYGSGVKLLIVFAAIYFTILGALIYIFCNRDNLYISRTKFLSLAFESLACPPFALNIVRNISLNYPELNDPLMIAKKVFDTASYKTFCGDLASVVEKNMSFIDVNSSHYKDLNKYLEMINKEHYIE